MLDVFVIEKIRRERERARSEDARVPLHIEPNHGGPGQGECPREEIPPDRATEREDGDRRGSVTVDFQL